MQRLSASTVYLMLSGGGALAGALAYTTAAVYFVTMVGMNPFQLVLVGTVMELTTMIFELPTGVVADTYSRRLSVIIGTGIMGAATLFQGGLPFIWAILLGSALWGFGYTFVSGALDAWLTDEVGPEHIGPIMLRAAQVGQTCGIVGAGISAILAGIWLPLPVILGGIVQLGLAALLILVMAETGFRPAPRSVQSPLRDLAATLHDGIGTVRRSSVLPSMLGVSLFVGLALEGFHRLQEAHLLANFSFPVLFGLAPVVWFGVISIGSQLVGIITAELFGRFVDITNKRTAGHALLFAQAAYIITLILFGLATRFEFAVGALLLNSMAGTVIGPLDQAIIAPRIDSRSRATVLSLRSMTNAFGQTIGGPAVGAIGTLVSLRAAMLASGLLLSPALVFYLRILRRTAPTLTYV
ncbi:MAG: MFS transporter [Roseiflexaceae bacterium]|nr:MFS transporter [Roseiflexaceae bacterium]